MTMRVNIIILVFVYAVCLCCSSNGTWIIYYDSPFVL